MKYMNVSVAFRSLFMVYGKRPYGACNKYGFDCVYGQNCVINEIN